MLRIFSFLVMFIFSFSHFGQEVKVILFPVLYSNDTSIDCAKLLNQIIAKQVSPAEIKFQNGKYHFKSALHLKSNISILGEEVESVKFLYDLKGKGDLINIKGTHEKTKYELKESAHAGAFEITVNTNELKPGNLIRLYKSNPTLELSSWAKESIGQIVEVVDVKGTIIQLKSSIKLDYSMAEKPMIEIIKPIENVIISNITIQRLDQSIYQTSNIIVSYANNCKLQNVVSIMTNFAHVSIDYSKRIILDKVDFYNSFSHGNGGNGYGVSLQYSSTDCIIQDCVFRKLRHGVVIQSGANGNVIRGNYALEGFWEDVRLPKYAAGDFVLHGNYPYHNFIEGNVCNQIVVDKSHGLNGFSIIAKNRLLKYGIFVQRQSIDSIFIKQNDIVKTKCFQGKIRGRKKDMNLLGNRKNGKTFNRGSDDKWECQTNKDGFKQIYKIGYPCDFNNFYNAAYFRYQSSLISTFN